MLRPQQMTVYISSVGTQQVHRPTHLIQLPNTKMEFGQMLETWPKLDIRMVQSPPDLQPWLSVVIHMNHICKCIFKQRSKLDLSYFFTSLSVKTELWELDSFKNDIIRPILSTHYQLLGLFLVDEGFCSKN